MNEKKFWELVEEIDWADVERPKKQRRYRSIKQHYDKTQKMLEEQLSEKEQLSMNKIFWRLRQKLEDRIEAWEKYTGLSLPVSDDSFYYLQTHIVGLGKEEYDKVLKDPKLAYDRTVGGEGRRRHDYVEGFAYAIPGRFPYFGTHFPQAKPRKITKAEKKRWKKDKV